MDSIKLTWEDVKKKFKEDEIYKEKKDSLIKELNKLRIAPIENFFDKLDLEGKFLRIMKFGVEYLYVDEAFQSVSLKNDRHPIVILRGLGFTGSFSGYDDSTSFYWAFDREYHINISNQADFESDISDIEIISEEDFSKAFDEHIVKFLGLNKKYMDSLLKRQERREEEKFDLENK